MKRTLLALTAFTLPTAVLSQTAVQGKQISEKISAGADTNRVYMSKGCVIQEKRPKDTPHWVKINSRELKLLSHVDEVKDETHQARIKYRQNVYPLSIHGGVTAPGFLITREMIEQGAISGFYFDVMAYRRLTAFFDGGVGIEIARNDTMHFRGLNLGLRMADDAMVRFQCGKTFKNSPQNSSPYFGLNITAYPIAILEGRARLGIELGGRFDTQGRSNGTIGLSLIGSKYTYDNYYKEQKARLQAYTERRLARAVNKGQ